MRDLASKLRAIVRTPLPNRPDEAKPRELTYVPDLAHDASDPGATASVLGGVVAGNGDHKFVSVDRVWDGAAWHGSRRVESFVMSPDAPFALFDPRLDGMPGLTRRPLFFDIETTGLAGGAGTIAFLVGCGWFEDTDFRVRQFFLAGPSAESAMLDALAEMFGAASMLVTYNGRTFDIPTMDMRWAYHRRDSPAADVPHFDMLPPARRLWGLRQASGRPDRLVDAPPNRSCSLTALERTQVGFHRVGDVPGFEIPARYFQYLRTGDARVVEDVLEHNRLDILSLAAVAARALALATGGPAACRESGEQVALGRLYERAGDIGRAVPAYEMAAAGADREVRALALARLAVLLRRQGRHDDAVEAWRGILDGAGPDGAALSPLERRATEALAIHHEHRARDLSVARHYAERLRVEAAGARADEVRHRLNRIDRKMGATGDRTGGPQAARLFEKDTDRT